jgi:hypothetical protein
MMMAKAAAILLNVVNMARPPGPDKRAGTGIVPASGGGNGFPPVGAQSDPIILPIRDNSMKGLMALLLFKTSS